MGVKIEDMYNHGINLGDWVYTQIEPKSTIIKSWRVEGITYSLETLVGVEDEANISLALTRNISTTNRRTLKIDIGQVFKTEEEAIKYVQNSIKKDSRW
jgi:hypothetical protein